MILDAIEILLLQNFSHNLSRIHDFTLELQCWI